MELYFISPMPMIVQKDAWTNVRNFLVFMVTMQLIDVFQYALQTLMEMMILESVMISVSLVQMLGLITQPNILGLTLPLISVPLTALDYPLLITPQHFVRLIAH